MDETGGWGDFFVILSWRACDDGYSASHEPGGEEFFGDVSGVVLNFFFENGQKITKKPQKYLFFENFYFFRFFSGFPLQKSPFKTTNCSVGTSNSQNSDKTYNVESLLVDCNIQPSFLPFEV